ncbi:MAG TPA: hypothetical protein VHM01_20275 [Alphaproteobacteria bacterium]|nr:hypothetical protein [Alphaproteobacteria bacterium]
MARAYGAELESLFVEDEQLFDCAAHSFVREVSLSGRQSRALSVDTVMRDLSLAAQGARRHIEVLARKAEVPLRCRVVRDEPIRALSIACAETGPWNVVALGEPFGAGDGTLLKQLMIDVSGSTGLIAVGPKGQQVTGRIIVAVENTEHLPDLLRAAERMAAIDGDEIVLLLIAPDEEQLLQMDGEARLVVEARDGVRIQSAAIALGESAVIAETLRRRGGGLVICEFGGLVVPDGGDLRPLASVLRCPLFVVR